MTPDQLAAMRQAAADILALPAGTSDPLSVEWARWVARDGWLGAKPMGASNEPSG